MENKNEASSIEVVIECPECKRKQVAKVLWTQPWNTYIHECMFCNYIIMESEWNEVVDDNVNKIIETHYGIPI